MAGQWFSSDIPGSSTNKTDRQDITEILLKVVLNTIIQLNPIIIIIHYTLPSMKFKIINIHYKAKVLLVIFVR